MQNVAAAIENSMEVPQSSNVELPHDLPIQHLGVYPEKLTSGSLRDINVPMFIAALVIIAKM